MARRDSVTARKTSKQSLPDQHRFPASIVSTRGTSQGKRPQGIKKREKRNPVRRSARLDGSIKIQETQQKTSHHSLPSPISDVKHLHVSHPRYSVMEY